MSQANRREEDEYIAVFQAFLEEHHREDITSVLLADDPSGQYCVVVNALELFDSIIEVSQKLLAAPNKMLPLFDGALAQAAVSIMQENATQISMSFKSHLHVRLSNLPICPELRRDKIPKTSDIGRFLAVSGEMTRWAVAVKGGSGGGYEFYLISLPLASFSPHSGRAESKAELDVCGLQPSNRTKGGDLCPLFLA